MTRRRSAPAPRRTLAHRVLSLAVLVAVFAMSAVVAGPAERTQAAESLDDISPVVSKAGFTHPGVFNSLDNLKTTKAHVLAGDAPWAANFRELASSPYVDRGTPDFTAFGSAQAKDPRTKSCSVKDRSGCVTLCGSFNNPDVGCSEEQADSRAVYAQALMYWYTGKETYAQRAVSILNAYSKHFKGNTGTNGPLITAWSADQMVRGAEILRYTYKPKSAKSAFDVSGFSNLLRKTFVPDLTTFDYGRYNGNWKLSAANGLMNIAVFLDDRELYHTAIEMWRERVRSYIYLSTDGLLPDAPQSAANLYQSSASLQCFWLAAKTGACHEAPVTDPGMIFQNGQNQESCRDLGHASMGLGGIINTAETAWIQGNDLYGEEQTRIVTGVLYAVQISQTYKSRGWPAGFCAGTEQLSPNLALSELPIDTVYNAYAIRKDQKMPAISIPGYPAPLPSSNPAKKFIDEQRAGRGYAGNVTAWEGLTHHLASVPYRPSTSAPTPSEAPQPTPSSPATAHPDAADANTPLGVATSIFAALGVIASVLVIAFAGRRVITRRKRE